MARRVIPTMLLVMATVIAAPRAVQADEHDARAPDETARVVLARFSTTYTNDADHKARASNVELSAEAINGKTIAPGATFSFNDAVGERTAAFGYAKSIVIRDGMIKEGMGGGACQVASTLHAAGLLGGLEVVLRAPHSRPSAYIRLGLDATVAMGPGSPAIDLKLKNPFPDAVTLRARAARGTLEVWVLGSSRSRAEITLTTEILERTAFSRAVERDKRAKEDTVRIKAFGIPGFRVRRIREVRAADGTARRDVRIDVYPPTPELLVVAPSFDESRILPRKEPDDPNEAPDGPSPAQAPVVVDDGVLRPVLVQLRPSTRVVLDNTAR